MASPQPENPTAEVNLTDLLEEGLTTHPISRAVGEPWPEWSTAVRAWGLAWEFYQFGFGAAFGILALLTIFFLVRILKLDRPRRPPKKASLVFLSLLFLFGLTRCLFLCTDAYHSKKILPQAFLNVLWSVGNPCIITAYTLVLIILRNIFHLRARFQGWYTLKNVAILTVPYFLLTLFAELVVVFAPGFQGVTFTCQIFYVLIGLMLCFFYSYVALLLWRNYKGTNFQAREVSRQRLAWIITDKNRTRRTLPILKTCIATVIGGVALCSLQIYAMTGVYGLFSNAVFVPAWPWLSLNYAMRSLELFLSFLLLATSRKGTGNQRRCFPLRSDVNFVKAVRSSRSIEHVV